MFSVPLQGISIFCDKMGELPPVLYDIPINDPSITPQNLSCIAILISEAGGNLAFQSNDGNVYQFEMVAGREYPVNLFTKINNISPQPFIPKILSGINYYFARNGNFYVDRSGNRYIGRAPIFDWQGNEITNTVTDLTWRGF